MIDKKLSKCFTDLSGRSSIADDECADESRVDITVVDGRDGEVDVAADLPVNGLLKLTSADTGRDSWSGS